MPIKKPKKAKADGDTRTPQAIARDKIAEAKRNVAERKRAPPRPPNPLNDYEISGNIEIDDAAETEIVIGAVERSRQTMKANMDQGYWCCLVFQSRTQMNAFLDQTGWRNFVDSSRVYVDGLQVAAAMGIALPPDLRHDTPHTADKRLVREVGIWHPGDER